MSETMRAVVAHGIGDYRFENVPKPVPKEGELLIKMEACGICAGDLKAFHGGDRFWGSDEMPAYVEPPCIPGHEVLGRVEAIGEGYTGPFRVGDRVTSEQIVPCGECYYCKRGMYWMCDPHNVYGFKNYLNGGMAEYMIFPKNALVYAVPDDLPLEKAVLIEPYACSMHGVDRAQIAEGDVLVISGAGTLGLGMAAYAHNYKPSRIIVLDMLDSRLELAKKLGATDVFNPAKCDVVKEIMAITGGVGCDDYIEVAGHPSSVLQGMQLIRKKGHFVEFSVFGAKTTSDWSMIGDAKELDLYGSSLSPNCFPKTIAGIASGDLPTEGVVTHFFPIEQFREGFEAAGGDGIKVALKP